MKQFLAVLVVIGVCCTVFAEEISELFKEFQRRDAVTFTKEEGQALAFLKTLKYDIHTINKFEFIDPSNTDRFVLEAKNGDICFADMSIDLLRCKNSMGLTTINYAGDAD